MRRIVTTVLLFVLATVGTASAQQKPMDAAQLQQALRKLNVLGSTLYVAAHPDDENTAMLAWEANDRLYRTGYLSMTRGDGGQNLIGDEKGELLGVIRTQELLAARRIDGAEQRFTRALDFGFSKGPVETLAIWGHDTILADVVWAIRRFQPDVIVTRFPTTGEGGHGHHTASAILAVEAFKAAADPTKFPEQLQYVTIWQPRRLFWNHFSFQQVQPSDSAVANSLRVDLGTFNPFLGRAYTEIAAESRSQHKSQGFGSAERRGSVLNYYDQLDGDHASNDLWEGINTTWSRYPGGDRVGKLLQQASDNFDPANPAKSIPTLLQAMDALDHLAAMPEWAPKQSPWIEVKRNELLNVIRGCAGLAIDVSAADSSVVPGGQLPITVSIVNRSSYPFVLAAIASPYADPGIGVNKKLENNQPIKSELKIRVPADAAYTQPYWLRRPPTKGTFLVDDQQLIGLPENPPAIPLTVSLQDGTHTLIFTVPAVYRWTDPVKGEQTRPVDVVPPVVSNLGSHVYLFPNAGAKPVTVAVQSFSGATDATVRLKLPAGWKSAPESIPVKLTAKGDEARATFTVTPPTGATATTAVIQAVVVMPDGKEISKGLTNIDYPHIPAQRVFNDATAKLVRLDLAHKGSRIGYVMGPGDEVPDALRQAGYEVTLLSDAELERGDFSGYDAIVTGVRAYNTRRRLRVAEPKLMQYVENGGTLVVQYNTLDDLVVESPGPYPFKITRDRVTVEEAPIRFVDPQHPLLNTPNKITQEDFNGWVQERGLYFTNDWDSHYQTILATDDPGESEKAGGELYARYGKGVYIYSAYDWFRELPAGVPGAYKLFMNMVSAR